MRTKCLPIHLQDEDYRRLEQRALATERDPLQMARWLLRQALDDQPDPARDLALAGPDRPDPQAA